VAAGFAAARRGARTLILEQFNCLGGVATAGGHGHICLYSAWHSDERVVGGIPYEMARHTAELGYGVVDNSNADFEVEGLKIALERLAEACGCELLYHAFFVDVVMDGPRVDSVVVACKDGHLRIRAAQVIDCTGDGDVAARAGCAWEMGDEETGYCQPMTLMFTIGGVEYPRLQEFRRTFDGPDAWQLKPVFREAQAAGDMRPFQSQVMGFWHTPTRPDQLGINFTHINHASCLTAADLTAATREGRRQVEESIAVFRKYIPGLERCYLISTPNTVGLRESRRVTGEYCLTREDVVAGRRFPDSIGWGSFFIDIHRTDGPGMEGTCWWPEPGFKYQIPYRILLPAGAANLQVAGRCASCTHEALGSLRVMPQCGVMGQAAGTAAALALAGGAAPREVEVGRLQEALRADGAIVTDEDVIPG
jgi:hypothetical protein